MYMQMPQAIMQIYPSAIIGVDFRVQDDSDGKGPYIAQWNVKDANGNIASTPTSADLQTAWDSIVLPNAKQAKINEILAAAAISLQTFTSTALGATPVGSTPVGSTPVAPMALTYLCGTNDMLMLEAEDRYMQCPDWDGKPILWYTVEFGDMEHSKEIIHKLYLDGRSTVQSKKYRAKDLVAQVTAVDVSDSVTLDQALANLSSISWSYP